MSITKRGDHYMTIPSERTKIAKGWIKTFLHVNRNNALCFQQRFMSQLQGVIFRKPIRSKRSVNAVFQNPTTCYMMQGFKTRVADMMQHTYIQHRRWMSRRSSLQSRGRVEAQQREMRWQTSIKIDQLHRPSSTCFGKARYTPCQNLYLRRSVAEEPQPFLPQW